MVTLLRFCSSHIAKDRKQNVVVPDREPGIASWAQTMNIQFCYWLYTLTDGQDGEFYVINTSLNVTMTKFEQTE